MIEMQESEHAESVFTDDQLRDVLMICGPEAKDKLLLPVPLGVHYDTTDNPLAKLG